MATPPSSFQCDICSKSFSKAVYLKKHKIIHTGDKRFRCEFCSKTCLRNGDLKKHMVKHTGERRYQCDVCAKTFSQGCHLKEHLLVHSTEKPASCNICWKCFKDSRSLRRHILVHTGQKPFRCYECCKTFSRSADLRTHMLVVHCGEQIYCCGECSRTFASQDSLKQHMKVHTAEASSESVDAPTQGLKDDASPTEQSSVSGELEIFMCSECFKCFSTDAVLQKHLLVHVEDGFDDTIVDMGDADSDKLKQNGNHKLCLPSWTGKRLFKCSSCSECFSEDCMLRQHMWVHDNEKHLKSSKDSCVTSKKRVINTTRKRSDQGECFDNHAIPKKLMVQKHSDNKKSIKDGRKPLTKKHMVMHPEEERLDYVEASTVIRSDTNNLDHENSPKSDDDAESENAEDVGNSEPSFSNCTDDKPFICDECSKSFSKNSVLKEHMLSHASKKDSYHEDLSKKGDAPKRSGRSRKSLIPKRHLAIDVEEYLDYVEESNMDGGSDCYEENGMLKSTENKPFTCDKCSKHFSEESHLKQHVKVHGYKTDLDHMKTDIDYCKERGVTIPYLPARTEDDLFKCGICSQSYSEESDLKEHMMTHVKEEDFDRVKPSNSVTDDEGDLYKCGICSQSFSEEAVLKCHMMIHMEEESLEDPDHVEGDLVSRQNEVIPSADGLFRCSQCSKVFPSSYSLRKHMPVHTGVRQFECDMCSKTFTLGEYLRAHKLVVHSDKKPYICGVCSKSFAFNATLKTHMMVHTGHRPYQCETCSKSFTLKGNLKRHIFLHCN
ncbi:zinc finger protein 729-like [Gigantopelta aegis]|uniref:zinc finger protein 729-like n=1 Tax=Gigantopelta aegis TaxID=1735272 RepID=UPI001B887A94|nr:zinc finger protein 729-like [Gigantopelta aegis]